MSSTQDANPPLSAPHCSAWVEAPDCAGWWIGWDGIRPRLREVTEIISRGPGFWIYENGFWRKPHELLWANGWQIVVPPNKHISGQGTLCLQIETHLCKDTCDKN